VRHQNYFLYRRQIFNSKKNDESSFTFFVALFGWTRENAFIVFTFYFSGQEIFLKQKCWIFLRLLWKTERLFWSLRRWTKTEMPTTSALGNSWVWRAFHQLFVRYSSLVPGWKYSIEQQDKNINFLFVYCTFVRAENSLNAQLSNA